MSQSISIPDDLYHHLVAQARKTSTPVETLIAHLLEQAISHSPDRELLNQITQAYAGGTTLPAVGNWDRIEIELATTASPFESLEAAMNYTRGRP